MVVAFTMVVPPNLRSTTPMPSLSTAFASSARLDSLDSLELFRVALAQGTSERQAAADLGLPRSTLRDRKARADSLDADPLVRAFFTSSAGLMVLHRISLALHVAFPVLSPVGLPRLSLFLDLSGLDVFVGSSHASQFAFFSAVLRQTDLYGQHQVRVLGPRMPPQAISLLQDETFHSLPLFVAVEPLSGYIVVESYGLACNAATWDLKASQALSGLPNVAVIQVGCDGGRALAAHVEHQHGVWLSPDLFHVLHDLVKVVLPALHSLARHAPDDLKPAALQRCQQATSAVAALSGAYHPFDLETGKARCAHQVTAELHAHLDALGELVVEAEASPTTWDAIGKSRDAIGQMAATIAFVHREIGLCMESLDISPEVRTLVREQLVPAFYLQRVATKTRNLDKRKSLEKTAQTLLQPLQEADSLWQQQPREQRAWWLGIAQACADLFQRSSSAAEGRNHRLRLMFEAVGELGEMRVRAQLVAQNFVVERPDGTTAGERFFGERGEELMAWLMERVPLPPRPAKRQRTPVKPNLLN